MDQKEFYETQNESQRLRYRAMELLSQAEGLAETDIERSTELFLEGSELWRRGCEMWQQAHKEASNGGKKQMELVSDIFEKSS